MSRCAPRSCGAYVVSTGERTAPFNPAQVTARTPSLPVYQLERERQVPTSESSVCPLFVDGTPRSPLPPSASLATDHSGHAASKLAVPGQARSLRSLMCLRRQRVSPSVAPLAGFRVPALGAGALAESRPPRLGERTDSRPEHGPAVRAGPRAGLSRWTLATGGSARGSGNLFSSGALSLAPQGTRAKAQARARDG